MPVIDHIHTYARWKKSDGKDYLMSGEQVFRCISPDCSHYLVKSLVVGKRSLCTMCGTEIILDKEALRRVKPRCIKCSHTKEAKALNSAADLLADFHLFDIKELGQVGDVANRISEAEKIENAQSK